MEGDSVGGCIGDIVGVSLGEVDGINDGSGVLAGADGEVDCDEDK